VPDEDRVLTVEVVDIVDIVPSVGIRVYRHVVKIVQDQLVLSSHTLVYRHVSILCLGNCLDEMLQR
jgi:hypothetical protein